MDRSWMPTVGGILSIVAGGISFIGGLFVAIIGTLVMISPGAFDYDGDITTVPVAVLWLVFLPYLVICVIAIVGGVFALKKRVWGLALAGAICTLLTLWAWWLGIPAIVFVALSKSEFNRVRIVQRLDEQRSDQ